MLKFIMMLAMLAETANAQNSPCYWSGSVVKCFPTTGIYLDKQKSLRLGDSGTTNYVELKGGSSITTYSVTLPTAQGAASTAMVNDGSGGLTWTAVSANPATAPILLADGSVSAPSLAFGSSGNTNTGLYLVGTDSPGFVANGVNVGQYSSAGAWTVGPSTGGDLTQTVTSGGQTTLSVLSTGSNVNSRIKISATGTGIPHLQLDKAGSTKWELGSDNSLFGTNGLYLVGGSTTVLGSTSAGAWTIGDTAAAGGSTYAGNKIVGVTNGTDTCTGCVGEIIESKITSLTNAAATGTFLALTHIDITSGAWDITSNVEFFKNAATISGDGEMAISTTSASNTGATFGYSKTAIWQPSLNSEFTTTIPKVRVNVTANTTYYINVFAQYSAGTPQWRGFISAERVH